MRTLQIVMRPGAITGQTIFEMSGSLELQQVFAFQNKMREDESPVTILDMTDIVYIVQPGSARS